MIWNICFSLSVAILVATVIYFLYSLGKYKRGRLLTPFNTLFAGTFLAVCVGLLPVLSGILAGEYAFFWKLVFLDALQAIQVFTINLDAPDIVAAISGSGASLADSYSLNMTILFFCAPILTFGFLASLFKDLAASLTYRRRYQTDAYIFSALNEKSLLLAQSLRSSHKRALIAFTNVDMDEGDVTTEQVEWAKELSALIFRKDILSENFSAHSPKACITFFLIGQKEGENLIQSLKLLSKYNDRENTQMYVFSSLSEGDLLLSNAPKGKIRLRRVNEVRSLVYRYLYDDGPELFAGAYQLPNGEKEINALVIGMGKTGTELTKALSWYCQMDGYHLNLHSFDKDPLAEEKFSALCPELMCNTYNGVSIPGESYYHIQIHPDVDVNTRKFNDLIAGIPHISYVFVCLGDDEDNINCAANIRMLCRRAGCDPTIRTVVYSADEKDAVTGVCNYRGQAYNIEIIGELERSYSEEILLGSQLENLALERHLKWGDEESFWRYEYNYRSSMASAVHMKARVACAMAGAGKKEAELTREERDLLENLEHKRWNAYMRSEGYVYSGSPDPGSRDDLAKMHHNLVPFHKLTDPDKRKDSTVGSL